MLPHCTSAPSIPAATRPPCRPPTPARSVPSQLLLASGLTPEQRELGDTILESGNTLLTILGDILDFSKVGEGQKCFMRACVSRHCVANCCEFSSWRARGGLLQGRQRSHHLESTLCTSQPYATHPSAAPATQIDHNSMALERAPLVLRDTVEASIEMVAADARRKGGCCAGGEQRKPGPQGRKEYSGCLVRRRLWAWGP